MSNQILLRVNESQYKSIAAIRDVLSQGTVQYWELMHIINRDRYHYEITNQDAILYAVADFYSRLVKENPSMEEQP